MDAVALKKEVWVTVVYQQNTERKFSAYNFV